MIRDLSVSLSLSLAPLCLSRRVQHVICLESSAQALQSLQLSTSQNSCGGSGHIYACNRVAATMYLLFCATPSASPAGLTHATNFEHPVALYALQHHVHLPHEKQVVNAGSCATTAKCSLDSVCGMQPPRARCQRCLEIRCAHAHAVLRCKDSCKAHCDLAKCVMLHRFATIAQTLNGLRNKLQGAADSFAELQGVMPRQHG